jgi:predicted amidohydrolase
VLVGPTGLSGVYRKIHLWDKEQLVFTPGRDPPAMDAGGRLGRVGALICYDLEFPQTADVVRAWGARFLAAPAAFANLTLWRATLESRARELSIPIVAANRLGLEGDTVFCGHSTIVNARGQVVADAGDSPGLALADLDVPRGSTHGGAGHRRRDPRLINPEFG